MNAQYVYAGTAQSAADIDGDLTQWLATGSAVSEAFGGLPSSRAAGAELAANFDMVLLQTSTSGKGGHWTLAVRVPKPGADAARQDHTWYHVDSTTRPPSLWDQVITPGELLTRLRNSLDHDGSAVSFIAWPRHACDSLPFAETARAPSTRPPSSSSPPANGAESASSAPKDKARRTDPPGSWRTDKRAQLAATRQRRKRSSGWSKRNNGRSERSSGWSKRRNGRSKRNSGRSKRRGGSAGASPGGRSGTTCITTRPPRAPSPASRAQVHHRDQPTANEAQHQCLAESSSAVVARQSPSPGKTVANNESPSKRTSPAAISAPTRVGSLVEPPSQRDNEHASHDNDSQQQDKPSFNNTSGHGAAADATAQQANGGDAAVGTAQRPDDDPSAGAIPLPAEPDAPGLTSAREGSETAGVGDDAASDFTALSLSPSPDPDDAKHLPSRANLRRQACQLWLATAEPGEVRPWLQQALKAEDVWAARERCKQVPLLSKLQTSAKPPHSESKRRTALKFNRMLLLGVQPAEESDEPSTAPAAMTSADMHPPSVNLMKAEFWWKESEAGRHWSKVDLMAADWDVLDGEVESTAMWSSHLPSDSTAILYMWKNDTDVRPPRF